jgi:hypothetical protein
MSGPNRATTGEANSARCSRLRAAQGRRLASREERGVSPRSPARLSPARSAGSPATTHTRPLASHRKPASAMLIISGASDANRPLSVPSGRTPKGFQALPCVASPCVDRGPSLAPGPWPRRALGSLGARRGKAPVRAIQKQDKPPHTRQPSSTPVQLPTATESIGRTTPSRPYRAHTQALARCGPRQPTHQRPPGGPALGILWAVLGPPPTRGQVAQGSGAHRKAKGARVRERPPCLKLPPCRRSGREEPSREEQRGQAITRRRSSQSRTRTPSCAAPAGLAQVAVLPLAAA